MASLRARVVAAYRAFREPYLIAEPTETGDFGDFESRRLRYGIFWAFYENSAYRNVHSWATQYRIDFGLYRYIRNIYNPAYRLGEFWKAHTWGGMLDRKAGDGEEQKTALPIVIEEGKEGREPTASGRLREAIATLWQWSNWQSRKDVVALLGAVLGDVGVRIVDDASRGKVYLEVVHPSIIKSVELDPFGNVKGYVFEESRQDPRTTRERTVTYTEICTRGSGAESENVVYQTLLNGNPYPWNGEAAEWGEPYGFVPLVMIQHNDVGLSWGWSELHPIRSKIHEVDDLASKLSDQIRKMVDSPWLLSGVKKSSSTITTTSQDSESYQATSTAGDVPYPGREEVPIFYGPEGAKAQALVSPLDLGATAEYIKDIMGELERDYPELQMDIWSVGQQGTSGRALRIARQRLEEKVAQRRASYDDALVRAQQMAISIGGMRGYEGFEGFGLESYGKGELEHQIGERGVFQADPMDDLEVDRAFWDAAKVAVKDTGVPLDLYLEWQGYEEERVEALRGSQEFGARAALAKLAMGGFGERTTEDTEPTEDGRGTEEEGEERGEGAEGQSE